MLSLFRTNQASAGLLLFFYALVLQLPVLLGWAELPAITASSGVAGTWVASWLEGKFYLSVLLPVVLLTGQGIIANVLVTRHRLSRKITQFPGLFLILCWALVPAFRVFHPVQAANLLLLFALLALGRVYKREEPAVAIFNVGGWLGLAVLFCPSYFLLVPAFVIGIGILRRLDFRSILQLLTGFALPLFLVLAFTYVNGTLTATLSAQFDTLGWWQKTWPEEAGQLGLALLGALLLLVMGSYGTTTQLLNIEGKKNVGILYWLLFFLLLSVGLSADAGIPYLQAVTVPIGMVIGLRFIMITPSRAEFFHLILFTAAVGTAIWFALLPG